MRISLLTVASLVALKCATAVAIQNSSDWDEHEVQRAIAASLKTHAEEEKARASVERHMENFKAVRQTTGKTDLGYRVPATIQEESNDTKLAITRSRLSYMDELKKSGQVTNSTKMTDVFPELKPKKTPKAAPVAPKAAPVAPKATPVAPKATPVAPKAAPVAPKAAPVAPKAAPVAPKAAPVAPKATPVAPKAINISAEQLQNARKSLRKTEGVTQKAPAKRGKFQPLQQAKRNLNKVAVSSKTGDFTLKSDLPAPKKVAKLAITKQSVAKSTTPKKAVNNTRKGIPTAEQLQETKRNLRKAATSKKAVSKSKKLKFDPTKMVISIRNPAAKAA